MTEARPLEVLTASCVLGWKVERHEGAWLSPMRCRDVVERLNSWSGLGLVVEAMEAKGWRLSCCKKTFAALRALGVDEDTINQALEESNV